MSEQSIGWRNLEVTSEPSTQILVSEYAVQIGDTFATAIQFPDLVCRPSIALYMSTIASLFSERFSLHSGRPHNSFAFEREDRAVALIPTRSIPGILPQTHLVFGQIDAFRDPNSYQRFETRIYDIMGDKPPVQSAFRNPHNRIQAQIQNYSVLPFIIGNDSIGFHNVYGALVDP